MDFLAKKLFVFATEFVALPPITTFLSLLLFDLKCQLVKLAIARYPGGQTCTQQRQLLSRLTFAPFNLLLCVLAIQVSPPTKLTLRQSKQANKAPLSLSFAISVSLLLLLANSTPYSINREWKGATNLICVSFIRFPFFLSSQTNQLTTYERLTIYLARSAPEHAANQSRRTTQVVASSGI